jgi:hypothetical protein
MYEKNNAAPSSGLILDADDLPSKLPAYHEADSESSVGMGIGVGELSLAGAGTRSYVV